MAGPHCCDSIWLHGAHLRGGGPAARSSTLYRSAETQIGRPAGVCAGSRLRRVHTCRHRSSVWSPFGLSNTCKRTCNSGGHVLPFGHIIPHVPATAICLVLSASSVSVSLNKIERKATGAFSPTCRQARQSFQTRLRVAGGGWRNRSNRPRGERRRLQRMHRHACMGAFHPQPCAAVSSHGRNTAAYLRRRRGCVLAGATTAGWCLPPKQQAHVSDCCCWHPC